MNSIKIKCPKCAWKPGTNTQWQCDCMHVWNTFDTAGACPACNKQWTETQCPCCQEWSAHKDWYIIPVDSDALLNYNNETGSKTIISPNPGNFNLLLQGHEMDIISLAKDWVLNRQQVFNKYPGLEEMWIWLFKNEPQSLIPIEIAMKQLSNGQGFALETPLNEYDINGSSSLLELLNLQQAGSGYFYGKVKGYIMYVFVLKNIKGKVFKLYNLIKKEYNKSPWDQELYCFEKDPDRIHIDAGLLNELKKLKSDMDDDSDKKVTSFEKYIKKEFAKDWRGLSAYKMPGHQTLKFEDTQFFGGPDWENMEKDLNNVRPENRKFFCVLLFMISAVTDTLKRHFIDDYFKVKSDFKHMEFGYFKGGTNYESPEYLLGRAYEMHIDFNNITQFELEEFIDDMFDVTELYLYDSDLSPQKILEKLLTDLDDCRNIDILGRIKNALKKKLNRENNCNYFKNS